MKLKEIGESAMLLRTIMSALVVLFGFPSVSFALEPPMPLAGPLTPAVQSSAVQDAPEGRVWTGIIVAKESTQVWELYNAAEGNLERFAADLADCLDRGDCQPAVGNFTFMHYMNGEPTGETHQVTLRPEHEGTWYFHVPAEMLDAGHALCVHADEGWQTVATQRLFPVMSEPGTNCIDGGPHIVPNTNSTAAAIIMVRPMDTGARQ